MKMKKILIFSIVLVVILTTAGTVFAGAGKSGKGTAKVCTTIQDGILLTSDGKVITTGFSSWG